MWWSKQELQKEKEMCEPEHVERNAVDELLAGDVLDRLVGIHFRTKVRLRRRTLHKQDT
jgi:hypothetical protein